MGRTRKPASHIPPRRGLALTEATRIKELSGSPLLVRRPLTSNAVRTWLDMFPFEICVRIASQLTLYAQSKASLYSLCFVSVKQTRAVLEAQNCELNLSYLEDSGVNAAQWARMFANYSVRHVVLGSVFLREALPLLRMPSLRSATITNRPIDMDAVARACNLKRLCIDLEHSTEVGTLIRALRMLRVEELGLRCVLTYPWQKSDCLSEMFEENFAELGEVCENVRWLELRCACYSRSLNMESFLLAFKNVRELVIGHAVPDSMLDRVREMDKVWLKDFEGGHACAVREAARLGNVVVGIVGDVRSLQWDQAVTVDEARRLKTCTRLERLELKIKPGVEEYLPKVEHIKLRWITGNGNPSAAWWASLEGIKALHLYRCKVDVRILEGVVRRCQEMEELVIVTNMYDFEEAEVDEDDIEWKILRLFELCCQLRQLRILKLPFYGILQFDCFTDWRARDRWLKQLRKVIRVLERVCIYLDTKALRRSLDDTGLMM